MILTVRSGNHWEHYELKSIVVDAGDGVIFNAEDSTGQLWNIKPPRMVRERIGDMSYIEMEHEKEEKPHYEDCGNLGDALQKGIVK